MYKSGHASGAFVFTAFVCLSFLSGCGAKPEPQHETQPVADDLGREVLVPTSPKRVISLAPSITEVMFAAGAAGRLIAVTTADDYPPAVSEMDKITAFPLDHEGIVARHPDLLLATDQINSVRDMDALSELGIPSYFLRFSTVSDVFVAVRTVGSLLQTSELANNVADSLESVWMNQMNSVDPTARRPTVLLLAGNDVLYSFGRDSYTNEIIEAAGGTSITSKLDGQAATLSDEFVLSEQPEFIIGTFGVDFDVGKILTRHPTWETVPAVKNRNVYSIDPDLISRPGPRVIDGARTIALWISEYEKNERAP